MKRFGLIAFLLLTGVVAHGQETVLAPPDSKAVDTKVTISGYVQIDARHSDPPGELETAPSHELTVRRARLGVSGKVTSSVSYSVVAQGDGGNANSASIIDASVDIALSESTRIRAGQFKYDFDIEGRESDHTMPLIDRPFVTNAVAGGLNGASTASSGSGTARDRGVSLIGELDHPVGLAYSAGVFQGSGRAADNNSGYSSVINVRAGPVHGVRVNLGYLHSPSSNEGAAERTYRAWTGGASWESGPIFVRGEYYHGVRESVATEDLDGFYLTGICTLLPQLDVMARFQTFSDQQFAGDASASSMDLGLKWFFARKERRSGTSIAVNYMHRDADAAFDRGLTLLNDGRGLALTDGSHAGPVLAARLQVRF